jgi:signal transduction histidine kinase
MNSTIVAPRAFRQLPRAFRQIWRHRPAATVRLRLTALYGGLFLAVGVTLLAITYALVARQLSRGSGSGLGWLSSPVPPWPTAAIPAPRRQFLDQIQQRTSEALARQRSDALHQLLTQSSIALAFVSVIAVVLGWAMAGRALRPLRDITATARRLSTHNLHERIDLRGPRDELKDLADTFDAMLARLAAAFDAQRRFIANASHELRTPLTVQRAAIDVALAEPRPTVTSLQTMARRIHAATLRHEHLIASLLTLARSERGVERYEPVNLADTVRAALDVAQPIVAADGVSVSRDLTPSVVHGERALLERLAANLIDNALRHNVPGGWVTARTSTDGMSATLCVANSGPVLPAAAASALFEPFRRHPPERTAGETGHGLGLSIVAAITAAHHGSCTAQPRPDGGLDVAVVLPVRPQ